MEWLIALVYYFKEIITSNLDLFYILALAFAFFDLSKYKGRNFFGAVVIWFPILLYALFQVILISELDITRLFINIFKIAICLFIFLFVRENIHNLNFQKFIRIISSLYILSIPISIVFMNKRLWTLNDSVNQFVHDRLRLFYFEPSELSFQVCILMILIIYFIIKGINRTENLFYLFGLSYVAYLSAGMGGIICLIISISIMLSIYFYQRSKKSVIFSIVALLILGGVVVYVLNATNNPLYLRVVTSLSGEDNSTKYRLMVGYEVMKNSLINNQGLGAGFGNLNTNNFKIDYNEYGLVTVIANSFMYFITEGGAFAVLYLSFLLFYVFKHSIRSNILCKFPLFLFIFLYQIPGGYFTNPMNWIVYGLICNERDILPVTSPFGLGGKDILEDFKNT